MPHSRAVPADLGKRPDNPETGERARVLDLFCCAGGAALGIRQAFDAIGKQVEIVGVDIKPRPRYPFRFVLGDALEHAVRAGEFDFVWASPPCQRYSVATPRAARRRHPDLVARIRDLLLATGVPFVIENVPGAPLIDPVLLCGSMFEPDRNLLWEYVQCTQKDDSDDILLDRMLSGTEGRRMQVRRHRLFEPHGFAVREMGCEHRLSAPPIEVAGGLGRQSGTHRKAWHAWMAKAALGIPAWHAMTGEETTECIPPAYAKYILSEFLRDGRPEALDGERIAAIEGLPGTEIVRRVDPDAVAKALSDSELVEKCVKGFRDLREAIPYLREARSRFAQPGRRVPVPGNPTWTEWVQTNLHVTVRRVQQLLSEGAEPREVISLGPKQRSRRLRGGDWRGLLKATERRNAQVFGSVEDPKRLAGTIRDFAQGIADKYARVSSKKLVVSVSVKPRK